MLMPTSSEFVALCRAQISLLTQGLGASMSVVYLTQQLVEGSEPQLVPIVAYPDAILQQPAAPTRSIRPERLFDPASAVLQNALSHPLPGEAIPLALNGTQLSETVSNTEPPSSISPQESLDRGGTLVPQRQLVLPLLHEAVVLGLLVVERSDRGWTEWEQTQVEQVAETIALACVMDQRYQWLEQERQQQQVIQARQHDLLDNLLHQLRNSLTALQTFGKLILKRLLPGDANRDIAASLVRETERLRDLSQQLESALETQAVQEPLSLPPAAGEWHLKEAEEVPARTSPRESVGLLSGTPPVLTPLSIEDVLHPLLASAETIAQDRNLILLREICHPLPRVHANATALREVLNNLIENALKYTPAGGYVLVQALVPSTVQVEVAVTDTGPGIPAEDQRHLYERHYRGVQEKTGIPGSGLGLAIARTLLEQMHGDIQLFSPIREIDRAKLPSAAVNHTPGTTFVVRLPIV